MDANRCGLRDQALISVMLFAFAHNTILDTHNVEETGMASIYGPRSGHATIQGTTGADTIVAYGAFNTIFAQGGDDVIYGGASHATVYVDTGNVSVTLHGAKNIVQGAPGETSADNTIANGNDTVMGTVNNSSILLGNGNNTVNLTGHLNSVSLGARGNDNVTIKGDRNAINLGETAYSIGYAPVYTITAYGNNEVISLSTPWLKSVSNNIVANGYGNKISAAVIGDGAHNYITANGHGDTITASAIGRVGGSTIEATGNDDTISINAGGEVYFHDTLKASSHNIISMTNNSGRAGQSASDDLTCDAGNTIIFSGSVITRSVIGTSGNLVTFNVGGYNTVKLTNNSKVYFHSRSDGSMIQSADTFTVGANSIVVATGGTSTGIANGAGDEFLLNGLKAGSTLSATLFGYETMKFGLDASCAITLSPSVGHDTILVQSDNTTGIYTGEIEIKGLLTDFGNNVIDLQSLEGMNGAPLTNFAAVQANTDQTTGNTVLHLFGGGSIQFDRHINLTASNFVYTTGSGPVA